MPNTKNNEEGVDLGSFVPKFKNCLDKFFLRQPQHMTQNSSVSPFSDYERGSALYQNNQNQSHKFNKNNSTNTLPPQHNFMEQQGQQHRPDQHFNNPHTPSSSRSYSSHHDSALENLPSNQTSRLSSPDYHGLPNR